MPFQLTVDTFEYLKIHRTVNFPLPLGRYCNFRILYCMTMTLLSSFTNNDYNGSGQHLSIFLKR